MIRHAINNRPADESDWKSFSQDSAQLLPLSSRLIVIYDEIYVSPLAVTSTSLDSTTRALHLVLQIPGGAGIVQMRQGFFRRMIQSARDARDQELGTELHDHVPSYYAQRYTTNTVL